MTKYVYNRGIDISAMPERIKRLPISPTGFPVPWFVTWFKNGEHCADGDGKPDFRIVNPGKIAMAVNSKRCWVCGGPMGQYLAFLIGPMCAINRVISEPPSHRECAIYAAKVCPFLSKPNMVRNERGMRDDDGNLIGELQEAAGSHIARNPGACCVWITKSYRPFKPQGGPRGGVLFSIGTPREVLWFAKGRAATRDEVMASIDSGYPILQEMARQEGAKALAALQTQRDMAMALVPD
ncbi:MAG TPA: hypothetical protein VM867_08290 [Xanthobacteraceae bacterium]|nr:hypothetical protein [Xanthobacteraceae bacterium]